MNEKSCYNTMSYVLYRNQKIPTQTIPEGTLLFRVSDDIDSDIQGVMTSEGRCITPHYNVYFYPNPFVAGLMLDRFADFRSKKHQQVFVTTRPIKVLRLINPSPFGRKQMTKKRTFLRPCTQTRKGCAPRTDYAYNPCFSETLATKYPSVVGTLNIAAGDSVRFNKKKHTLKKISKYVMPARDVDGFESPPELQIHPLAKRPTHNVLNTTASNYKHLATFDRNNVSALVAFMQNHAVYNPETYFYKYK